MIDYKRTSWYGWNYLCQNFEASVLPKTLPTMTIAALLGGWASSPVGFANFESFSTARELFGETYGVQVFGIVFGYLCIARLNVCYARYWEGVSHVKMMHSKWSDAAAQAVAFDRVGSKDLCIADEPFCRHLIRLFSQLSALATMSLHINKAGLQAAGNGVDLDWLRSQDSMLDEWTKHDRSDVSGAGSPMTRSASFTERRSRRRKHAEALKGVFTEEELNFYDQNRGCAVHTTVNRILRTLTTRMKNGGLPFPPPIISRIYQELSNGLLAYNQAMKMKEVPVPFVYVQYNALLLLFYTIVTPFAVGAFTSSYSQEWPTIVLSAFLSAFIVGSFTAMWLVANELEDPFGMEPNDISIMEFHHEYITLLRGLLHTPWMEEDYWESPAAIVAADEAAARKAASEPDAKPAAARSVLEIATSPSPADGRDGAKSVSSTSPRWDSIRKSVQSAKMVETPAGASPAASVALRAFSSRAQHHRLRGLMGLTATKDKEEEDHAKYVEKMRSEIVIISGKPRANARARDVAPPDAI